MESIGIGSSEFIPGDVKHLRTGQSAKITVDGKSVGSVGRLQEEIASAYKFRQPVYLSELNLSLVLGLHSPASLYTPLSKYPGITRDVSFIADRAVTFVDICKAVNGQNSQLCRNVQFVEEAPYVKARACLTANVR